MKTAGLAGKKVLRTIYGTRHTQGILAHTRKRRVRTWGLRVPSEKRSARNQNNPAGPVFRQGRCVGSVGDIPLHKSRGSSLFTVAALKCSKGKSGKCCTESDCCFFAPQPTVAGPGKQPAKLRRAKFVMAVREVSPHYTGSTGFR